MVKKTVKKEKVEEKVEEEMVPKEEVKETPKKKKYSDFVKDNYQTIDGANSKEKFSNISKLWREQKGQK